MDIIAEIRADELAEHAASRGAEIAHQDRRVAVQRKILDLLSVDCPPALLRQACVNIATILHGGEGVH